jgi:FtsH-binding integral membrane protein
MSKITWILTIVSLFVIYLIILNIRNQLTPSNYIINTYLYITLAILLVGDTWMILDDFNTNIESSFNFTKIICLTIITFGSLFVTVSTSNDQYFIKHIAWTTLVLSLGVLTYVHYKINVENSTLLKTLIMLLGVMATLSYIAWTQPIGTFDSWRKPLLCILCTMIIIEIIDFIFSGSNINELLNRQRIYSWVLIFVFSGFVLYDTQKIVADGNNATIKNADYPTASLGIFLDMLNLFQNITNVSN